ncbi:PQQ-dependent sugar dehydrogenase [Fulvivirga sp.]|uniref:PQQ-dependent sugar dehydrogenase n=1 Tax=Fulvivirga sp. TaxID=1931237 RepID=UPI0032F0988F
MKIKVFVFLMIICISQSFAQTDQEQITKVLNQFIIGTQYNYPDSIAQTFYPGTRMFLYNGTDSAFHMTSEHYASLYGRKAPGTLNNRPSKIIGIEIVKDVAYAKLEVDIPSYGNRYHDLLLLKKILGYWKIVGKVTSAEPIPKKAEDFKTNPSKEVILEGLNKPWSMAFLSEDEVLIAEKDGDILRVNLKTKERVAIAGLPKDVARAVFIDTTRFDKGIFPKSLHGQTQSFNAGWFQILLDPDFGQNKYVYISYAAEDKTRASTTKVIRGKLNGNQLEEVETLFVAEPYVHGLFHYGGGMIFGKDGKLYITIGERNFFEYMNPEIPVAQDLKDKRGKVIRLNGDGSVPGDNPDFGPDAIKGLYALGIRAAQGLTVHPETGDIWFSEHGTVQGDELNIMKASANYGWPNVTTGKYRTDYQPKSISGAVFTDPIYAWDKTVAPTGLTFYSGPEFPLWNGNLIVPGLNKGSLLRMVVEGDQIVSSEELFINDRVRLRKAVVSPRGQLYLLTDEENGKLIRVFNAQD